MNDVIIHFFEFLAAYIEPFIGLSFCGILHQEKNEAVWRRAVCSLVIAIVIYIINQYQLFSFGTTVIAFGGITIGIYLIYRELNIDDIMLTILYLALVYTVDFLSITFVGVLIGRSELAQAIAETYSEERIYLLIVSKTLLVIISKILIERVVLNVSIPIRKFLLGIVLLVGVIYYLVQNTLGMIDFDITIAWFFLLLLFLLAIYTAVQYMKHYEEKKQWEWDLERGQVLIENYDRLITIYQEKQMFYHDLKNHYLVLGKLIRNNDYEKANEYLLQLNFPEYESLELKRTGIRTIDILINHKIMEAENCGILVKSEIDAINLSFSEQEMTALLGNILDNAIEACCKVSKEQKWIAIQIKKQYNMLFIKVSNSYEQKLNYVNGRLVSVKKNPQQHGWGISSIKIIAERRDGIVKINTDENVFTIHVSFFY